MQGRLHVAVEFFEGWLPFDELIDEAAKRPNVSFPRVWFTIDHFRAHPSERANVERLSPGLVLGKTDREAKVCKFDLTVALADEIVRLNVTMQNAKIVHRIESFRRAPDRILDELF